MKNIVRIIGCLFIKGCMMNNKNYEQKSITIRVESEEELTKVKALMLSLDISFKIEEKYSDKILLNKEIFNGRNIKSQN